MNLFHCVNLIQAVRDAYDLSIPQATCVLIAYQHGTVSVESARLALNYDSRALSGSHAISKPVRKGLLKEAGKARLKPGARPSKVYALVDREALNETVKKAAKEASDLFRKLDCLEKKAKELTNCCEAD